MKAIHRFHYRKVELFLGESLIGEINYDIYSDEVMHIRSIWIDENWQSKKILKTNLLPILCQIRDEYSVSEVTLISSEHRKPIYESLGFAGCDDNDKMRLKL